MIEQSFEYIKHGSYPQNADFDDLPIEYEQSLLTKRLIYLSTNNIVERLIARRRISRINDDIVFRLKNGSSVDL